MTLINLCLLHLLISSVLAARPGPPEILGRVTVESPLIRLANVVNGATVKVYDAVSGGVIAVGIGAGDISSIPTIRLPLNLGHDVVAEQITSEGPSGKSRRGQIEITKIEHPGPPAIISRTHLCMRAIQVGNIILGATVVAHSGAKVFASKVADESPTWLELDPTVTRLSGDVITIEQSITYSSGTFSSSTRTDPLESFHTFMNLRVRGPISIQDPLVACAQTLKFTYATPGAFLTRETVSLSATSWAPDFQFTLHLSRRLDEGPFRITESLWDRCEEPDLTQDFLVFPAEPVKPPIIDTKPCFDSPKVYFKHLFEYGSLFLSRKDASGEDTISWPIGEISPTGEETSKGFNLPEDWTLKDAEFKFWQTDLCDTESSKTLLALDDSAPNEHLEITQPIYECSSFVTYKSGPSSAETRVWSETEGPISNTFQVDLHSTPPNIHTPDLWGPLKVGNIFLRQEGCNTNLKSPSVPVEPLPAVLPKPSIPGDILAPQQYIHVTGVLKGAIVKVYVDNKDPMPIPIEYGTAEAFRSDVVVPLDPPRYAFWLYPLQLGDTVYARQFFPLCDREQPTLSPFSEPNTPVKRGFLKATWSGTSVHKVRTGDIVPKLHLKLVDRDTGACVRGTGEYHVVPDRGYMFAGDLSSTGCLTLCDCDMQFIIPDTDTVSSLTITLFDHIGAYEAVDSTITVLPSAAAAVASSVDSSSSDSAAVGDKGATRNFRSEL